MNPALLFLARRSLVNGILSRLKRLKNPRYLIPTILGLAYFGLIFARPGFGERRDRAGSSPAPAETALAIEWGAAMFGLLLALTAWFLPARGAPLAFLESEVAILFPAPVRRRELVNFKLLDMQKYLLLMPLFFSIFWGLRAGFLRGASIFVGGWLYFNVLTLHQIGARFTRQSLLEHGMSGFRRTIVPLSVVVALALVVVFGAPPLPSWNGGAHGFFSWLGKLGDSPAGWALYPFRILGRPVLAADLPAFLARTGLLAGLAGLLYLWVIRCDVAFEESAVDHAADLTRRIEAARKGRFPSAGEGAKPPRRALWRLGLTGPPEVAFVWKSVTETLRGFSPRILGLLFAAVMLGVLFAKDLRGENSSYATFAVACAMLGISVMLVFGGPSFLGSSLRAEMENVEALKSLPLPGDRLVRASLAGAVAPTVALQAALILAAAYVIPDPKNFHLTPAWRVAGAAALTLLLPALATLSALIDSAGVLYFPGWVRPGQTQVQGGVEGMGHGIVIATGKFLLLALGSLVPGGAGTLVVFVVVLAAGPVAAPSAVVVAAVVAAALVAAECWVASLLLGKRFDRLDPAAEGLIQ